ncbi:MAG: aspartate/glutamate racemase family protein [Lachnospiraceae bacterium]
MFGSEYESALLEERLCGIAKGLALESGAGAVVLGCTELPMILNESLLQIPCLDVSRIHIETLIRMICGEEVIA